MQAWVAWEYLVVFCSASRQQKYTAAGGMINEYRLVA
jgi:hypothetical protein